MNDNNSIAQLITDMKESLERELGSFRTETMERFSQADRRLERVENRLTGIEMNLANINRSMDDSERRETEAIGTRAAQQRAIDDLASRVSRIEQRLEGRQ